MPFLLTTLTAFPRSVLMFFLVSSNPNLLYFIPIWQKYTIFAWKMLLNKVILHHQQCSRPLLPKGLVMVIVASLFLLSCNQATSNILKWVVAKLHRGHRDHRLMFRTKYHLRRLRCITVRVCIIHLQNIAILCCKFCNKTILWRH